MLVNINVNLLLNPLYVSLFKIGLNEGRIQINDNINGIIIRAHAHRDFEARAPAFRSV